MSNIQTTAGSWFRPFARLLARDSRVTCEAAQLARQLAQRERVDVRVANEVLAQWVSSTGDEDLGLKAGALAHFGERSVLDFAMQSASSLRERVALANSYSALVTDALKPRVDVANGRAVLAFHAEQLKARTAIDYALSAWYHVHLRDVPLEKSQLECWLRHSAPRDLREYRRTFRGVTLRFDAPCTGFVFPEARLDAALAAADEMVHDAHCQLLRSRLERLGTRRYAQLVLEVIVRDLRKGPTSTHVAKRLRISRRTLVRLLANEGTTYKILLERVRRQLGCELVVLPGMSIRELSSRLGFTRVAAFYRAFRRWTGQTPHQFREEHRTNASIDRGMRRISAPSKPPQRAQSG